MLTIGGGDTEEQQLFRVVSALRLRDGRIVVANAGTHELRFYDANGSYVSASGRRGGGPGEFEQLSWARLLGRDSLVVYDSRLRRASVYGTDGEFARAIPFQPGEGPGFPRVIDRFADGTFLVRASTSFRPGSPTGLIRAPVRLMRYSADLTTRDSLGVFPGSEAFVQSSDGGRGITVMQLMFGKSTEFLVRTDRFYVAANDAYEVQMWGSDGRLQLVVRNEHEEIRVERSDIDAARDAILASVEGDSFRRRLEGMFRDMPIPETFPAYAGIHVDDLDHLWVREYDRPGGERGDWTVFAPDGTLLGTLNAGGRFRLLHVGTDFVLGRWQDEDDVEFVRMYELIKPE